MVSFGGEVEGGEGEGERRVCSSGRRAHKKLAPLAPSKQQQHRQPASEYAATECWVYLSTDTERSQR